jgi:hypothetical protein
VREGERRGVGGREEGCGRARGRRTRGGRRENEEEKRRKKRRMRRKRRKRKRVWDLPCPETEYSASLFINM